MTKLEALAATSKRYTNSIDGKVISNASVIGIITYYEYLLDTNPIEVKYMSGIESNFIEEELNEADYWDGDESQTF
jgi:hypothetical protein